MPARPDEVDSDRVELRQSAVELREIALRLQEVSEQLDRLAAERAGLHRQYATSMERVWRAVRAADRSHISVSEMVGITGFPRHWLYRRVNSKVAPTVVGRAADLGGRLDSPGMDAHS